MRSWLRHHVNNYQKQISRNTVEYDRVKILSFKFIPYIRRTGSGDFAEFATVQFLLQEFDSWNRMSYGFCLIFFQTHESSKVVHVFTRVCINKSVRIFCITAQCNSNYTEKHRYSHHHSRSYGQKENTIMKIYGLSQLEYIDWTTVGQRSIFFWFYSQPANHTLTRTDSNPGFLKQDVFI